MCTGLWSVAVVQAVVVVVMVGAKGVVVVVVVVVVAVARRGGGGRQEQVSRSAVAVRLAGEPILLQQWRRCNMLLALSGCGVTSLHASRGLLRSGSISIGNRTLSRAKMRLAYFPIAIHHRAPTLDASICTHHVSC